MSATTVGCRCTSKRKCPWTSCTPRAPSPSPSSAPSAACGKCSRCDSRPGNPRAPAFAPGAGAPTLRSPASAGVSCRSTALGAKAESNHNPRARPHSHPGRVLLPSGLLRQPRFHVGAPPRCESGVKPQPPSPPPSHPGRVLLPSGVLRQPRFHVGAPPTVRKRSQTPTTEPTPFAPGAGAPCISPRVLVSYQHFGRTKACGAPEGN